MKLIAFSLCLPLVALGCSSKDSKDTPVDTTVRGALALSTFTATPTGVQAIDENGAAIKGKLAADGSFSLVLPKDHTYRLVVITGSSSEPIVFPRATGKLDTTFRMSGGGAAIALGSVRHYDAAPAGGFISVGTSKQLLSSEPAPAEGAEGTEEEVECVDGVVQGTGAVCIDDDAEAVCEAEGGDGEVDDDAEEGAEAAETEEDGECEDGVDATTGAACVDDDADPTGAMAVPEHNAPDDVAGCEDEDDEDGEEEDDD